MLGADGSTRRLILSPGRAHLPAGWRAWGWAAQLYAMRSESSWGMGDLGDLRELARWSREELGAGFVLVNPLHAVTPTGVQQPSPYFPTSRRFRNPIYLRVPDVPGAAGISEVEAAARAGRALNGNREIDRDQVWRIKRAALEAIWRAGAADAAGSEFADWQRLRGNTLAEFATFCVLSERFGPCWPRWPAEYRRPDDRRVREFAEQHADRVRFFAWLQWLTHRQLDDAAAGTVMIQDLPIGVDPDGADAWSWQDLLALDVRVGAPPDEFNTGGQDWGLPPFIPWRLRSADYQPFIDAVRATTPAGGGLRVDHVMGLFRLWWIPPGGSAADGAYVRYPAQDLLEIVALESHRARTVVVGEDLGTVEPGVRETMAEHGLLSYRLLWFETDDPRRWPAAAMAAVTTHDLPTVAGLWDGSDLAAQRELGLDPNEESTAAIRDRLAREAGLEADDDAEAAVTGAYRLLGSARSMLLAATLDDALAEPQRPNIPGADDGRPNWRLALPVPLGQLQKAPLAHKIAVSLRAAVQDRTEETDNDE
jgi:4-alpha-glucanotransferase